jgi:hypothetical protein
MGQLFRFYNECSAFPCSGFHQKHHILNKIADIFYSTILFGFQLRGGYSNETNMIQASSAMLVKDIIHYTTNNILTSDRPFYV